MEAEKIDMQLHLTRQNQNFHFEAKNPEGDVLQIDNTRNAGGAGKGLCPMELLLAGIASCSAMDIVVILQKQNLEIIDFQVQVNGDRSETIPTIFTHIRIHYILTGDIPAAKIERAISLSLEKYCPVAQMLNKAATIESSYILHAN